MSGGLRAILGIAVFVFWSNAPSYGAEQIGTATGQDGGAALRVFLPADFEPYAPVTARDALNRLPGLDIVSGDDGRGLGTGGNVLINGNRVGGKSNTALDQLARLPASRIAQVEVFAAGANSFDAGGSTQIINVVLVSGERSWSLTYNLDLEYEPRFDGFTQDAEVNIRWDFDDSAFDLAFEKLGNVGDAWAPETLSTSDGILLSSANEVRDRGVSNYELTLGGEWTLAPSEQIRVTAVGWIEEIDITERTQDVLGLDGFLPDVLFLNAQDQHQGEITAEYERPFAKDGQLKFVALQSYRESKSLSAEGDEDAADLTRVLSDTTRGESVLRVRALSNVGTGHLLTGQLEGAYNFLQRDIFVSSVAGDLASDDNLLASTKVEEYRASGFIEHQFAISAPLRLTTRLGAEVSNIKVSGTAQSSRTFAFPTPTVELVWQAASAHTFEFSLERVIGQLDFFNFAANVSLDDDQDRAPTGQLRPQREWRTQATWDAQLPRGAGRSSLQLFYTFVQDQIEFIPLSDTQEAAGNVGSARRFGMTAEVSARLQSWGLPNILLEADFTAQQTRILDPVTDGARRISRERPLSYSFSYRHDVTDWNFAYGADADFGGRNRIYEQDQIIDSRFSPGLSAFVESQALDGMVLRLRGRNLLDRTFARTRTIYDPNRRLDTTPTLEQRDRKFGRTFVFEVEGQF